MLFMRYKLIVYLNKPSTYRLHKNRNITLSKGICDFPLKGIGKLLHLPPAVLYLAVLTQIARNLTRHVLSPMRI